MPPAQGSRAVALVLPAAGLAREADPRLRSSIRAMNRRRFLATTLTSALAVAAGAAESPDRKLCVAVIGLTGHDGYGHGLE
jgi:hypothetical protein